MCTARIQEFLLTVRHQSIFTYDRYKQSRAEESQPGDVAVAILTLASIGNPVTIELVMYDSGPVIGTSDSPLKWWSIMPEMMPILSKMENDRLPVKGTRVSPESVL